MTDASEPRFADESRRPGRRTAALLLLLSVLLLLVIVGTRAALPSAAKLGLELALSSSLVEAEIERVRLDLSKGLIAIERGSLRLRDTGIELAAVARVTLELDWSALRRGVWEARSLTIDDPSALIEFAEDGSLNWAAFRDEAGGDASKAAQEPPRAFDLRIAQIAINAGVVRLIDASEGGLPELRLLAGVITLQDLEVARAVAGGRLTWGLANVDARDWKLAMLEDERESTDLEMHSQVGPITPEGAIPFQLEVVRENGVEIKTEGVLRANPLELTGHVEWKELNSRRLLTLTALSGARIEAGSSSGEVDFEVSLGSGSRRGCRGRGRIVHRDLVLVAGGETATRLEIEELSAEVAELYVPIPEEAETSQAPVSLRVTRLELVAPLIDAVLPSTLVTETPAEIAADTVAAAAQAQNAGFDVSIDEFSLRRGRMSWIDPAIGSREKQHISSLELEGRRVRWPLPAAASDAVSMTISGRVQWQGVQTRAAHRWLELPDARIEGGSTSGDIDFELSLGDGPRRGCRGSGRIAHRDLVLVVDGETATHVELEELKAEIAELHVPIPEEAETPRVPVSLRVTRLELVAPRIDAVLPPTLVAKTPEEIAVDTVATAAQAQSAGFDVRIDEVSLRQGRVSWIDPAIESREKQHISSFELEGRRVRWPLPTAASDAEPMTISGRVQWHGIQTRAAHRWLELSDARIERGSTSGGIDFDLSLGDGPRSGLRTRGRVTHDGLDFLMEGAPKLRLRVERVSLGLREARWPIALGPADTQEELRVHLSDLVIEAPEIDAIFGEDEDEGPPPAATAAGRSDDARAIDVRLDSLALRRGRISWRDREVGVEHEQTLSRIELNASGVRWPGAAAEHVRLEVGSLGAEPLSIDGRWAPGEADLKLRARRVPIAPWNPLIEHHSDYSVSRGDLSFDGPFRLRGEAYEAPINLRLRKLEVTTRTDVFQNTFGMALTEATALLSDQAGTVQLQLPIRGSLSEGASVDLEGTILDALREAIMNATSNTLGGSLNLAGAALRRVAEIAFLGIGEVAFIPGEDTFRGEASLVLDSAAELVRTTKGAQLELVPRIVTNDLRALGIEQRREGFFSAIEASARALLGGSRALDSASRQEVDRLVEARLAEIARRLDERARLTPEQIVTREWNGRVADGDPGVLLRLQIRSD